uniref:C2H2-type domain-containing protein n=1 Tax=Salarias fasciatus TaxID=181472 RepID=A0A672HQ48_SALFA
SLFQVATSSFARQCLFQGHRSLNAQVACMRGSPGTGLTAEGSQRLYAKLQQHHDCREEQLFKQETHCCLEQEEPEPPQVKEEPEEQEEPEPPQIKEEPEEPGLLQFPESEKQAGCEKILCVETCGETVRKKPKLSRNSGTVTEKKKISCEVCGKGSTCQSALLLHMRTHTGEKPFSCQTCGKSFSSKSYLFVHLKIHTGVKPHSCKTCEKSFIRRSHLLRHMRTHR